MLRQFCKPFTKKASSLEMRLFCKVLFLAISWNIVGKINQNLGLSFAQNAGRKNNCKTCIPNKCYILNKNI